MAITTINVGNIANDGTGDDLREAFIKVNDNFTDVNSRITSTTVEAINLGIAGESLYAGKDDGTLQFKKLIAGTNTVLTSNPESITISSTGGMSELLVLSDNGSIVVAANGYLGVTGDNGVTTRINGSNIVVELAETGIVAADTSPTLSQNLNANDKRIQNVNTINANEFIGPVSGLVYGVDVRTIGAYFTDYWDFGPIVDRVNYDSIIEFMIRDYTVDMGGFIGETVKEFNIDLGAI
jgi:hypothetical protein